jgi:three-Cys-motif partner protein
MFISEIGYWSEIKLDIIKEYAKVYSTILSKQSNLKHVYIDAFAGAGYHITKVSGELVLGSPLNALYLSPPFSEYHFIDLDKGKKEELETIINGNNTSQNVHIYNADCNKLLLEKIFPLVKYENYKRGLCLLDPYGLHLDWDVILTAGQMRSIEIFLNFPIADMNRNVLRRDETKVENSQLERMNRYWGDDSWKSAAYSAEENLFGYNEKTNNENIVDAFVNRLKKIAGFSYVPVPIPMRNTKGGTVYYLIFASNKPVAAKIVSHIFNKYKDRNS